MTPLYSASQIVHRAILSCTNYEQLTGAEALLHHFRMLYNCQQGHADYMAMLIVVDAMRAKIARHYVNELKQVELRYSNEWAPGDPTDAEGAE